ncbi:MBG domain-containing protein, partial [Furfurilactobacillus siliginis]
MGLGLLEGGITARADKAPTVNDQATPNTATPSGKANDSGNSVVLKTSQAAPASAATSTSAAADQQMTPASAQATPQSAAKATATSAAASEDATKSTPASQATADQKTPTSAASLSTPKSAVADQKAQPATSTPAAKATEASADAIAPKTDQKSVANTQQAATATTANDAATPAAQTDQPKIDVDGLIGKLPKGSTVQLNQQTGVLNVQMAAGTTAAELDAARKLLGGSGAKSINMVAMSDTPAIVDTEAGGYDYATYDITDNSGAYESLGQIPTISHFMIPGYGPATVLSPLSFLGDKMSDFNAATIEDFKNADIKDFIVTLDGFGWGPHGSLLGGAELGGKSDEFYQGYKNAIVDVLQGYLDAYNVYDGLLDAETKENTTSYMYGVMGANEGWAQLKAKMAFSMQAGKTNIYTWAYNDFVAWLTSMGDPAQEDNSAILVNRPLYGGIASLGALNTSSWIGNGDNSQKLPTADKFWTSVYNTQDINKPGVFFNDGNGHPTDIIGNSMEPAYPQIFLNLGRKISDATLDQVKEVYAEGVKQAALDAMQGKRIAVEDGYMVTTKKSTVGPGSTDFQALSGAGYFASDPILQNADLQQVFVNGYRYAKYFLTKNDATLNAGNNSSFTFTEKDGYLVPTGVAKTPKVSAKENPIDKAIISVLSGISTTYDVVKDSSTVTTSGGANLAVADNDNGGVYSAGHYVNAIYNLALQVAYGARADWTTAAENQINGIESSTGLTVNKESAWYKESPYVYTTVFNALNTMYHTDSNEKSYIVQALNKADHDIVISAANNNGIPTISHDSVPVNVADDFLQGIDLNASAYYDSTKYDTKAIGVSKDSTVTNDKAQIKLGIDKTAAVTTQSTMQNVVDYAYYHEQAVAAAAFEAGYGAANKGLNLLSGLPDKAPLGDEAKYNFQYHTDLVGSLYPAKSDFGESNKKTLIDTSANSDGTTTKLTLTTDEKDNFISLKAEVESPAVLDKDGNVVQKANVIVSNETTNITDVLSLQYAAPHGSEDESSGMSVVDGSNSQAYIHLARVDYPDGTFKYRVEIQRNSLMNVTPNDDRGGAFNNVYKSGYNYRRSQMSTIEVTDKLKKDNQELKQTTYYSFKDDKLVVPDRDETTGAYRDVPVTPKEGSNFKSIAISNDGAGVIKVITVDKNGVTQSSELKPNQVTTIGDKDKAHLDAWINADGSISLADYSYKGIFTATQTQLLSATPKSNAFIDKTIPAGSIGAAITGISGTDNPDPESVVTSTDGIYADALEPNINRVTILMPHDDQAGVILVPDHNRIDSDNEIDKDKGMSLTFVSGEETKTDDLTAVDLDENKNPTATQRPNVTASYTIGKRIDAKATIPYVAINKLADGKKDAAGNVTIDTGVVPVYDAAKGVVTIDLSAATNSYRNVANGTATPNVGPQIFDWTKVTLTNSQWTISADGKTLTYTPTADEKKLIMGKGLHLSIQDDIDNVDTTPDYMSDKVYLNAFVSSTVRTTIEKTINTSTDLSTTDHKSYILKNADLLALVPAADLAKFSLAFDQMKGKSFTATTLPTGMTLPTGVTSIAIATNGDVTVTFDPTADISATPEIVLPLSFNDDGTIRTDETDNLPASSLTMKLTLQANVLVKNVVKPDGKTELPGGSTIQAVQLGASQSDTTKKDTITKDAGSYDNYKLYSGDETKTTTVKFATFGTDGTQNNNELIHNYSKTLGYVWKDIKGGADGTVVVHPATAAYPQVTDSNQSSAYEGISFEQRISGDQLTGLDLTKLQPIVSTDNDGITRTNTFKVDGTDLVVTTAITGSDASKNAYIGSMYVNGFSNNFVLTDGTNEIAVIERSNILDPSEFTTVIKEDTINVKASAGNYVNKDGVVEYNFNYKVDDKLNAKKILALTFHAAAETDPLDSITLDSNLDEASIDNFLNGYLKAHETSLYGNDTAANYHNLDGIDFGTIKDGQIPVTVKVKATTDVANSTQSIVNMFVYGESFGHYSAVKLTLHLQNSLIQDTEGLDKVTDANKPVYAPIENKELGTSIGTLTAQAVTGYHVTGAKDQNGDTLSVTLNTTDGTATYNTDGTAKYNFGIKNAGDAPKELKVTWIYAQNEITATLSNESKVYDGNAATDKIHTVTLPSFLVAPTGGWVLSDFQRQTGTGNDSQDVKAAPGYVVTLSATGIARLQAANTEYTIDATTLPAKNITDGHLVITPAAATYKLTGTDTKVYDGTATDIKNILDKYSVALTAGGTYTLVDGDIEFADSEVKNVKTGYVVKLTQAG